jgi:hypothetical protein
MVKPTFIQLPRTVAPEVNVILEALRVSAKVCNLMAEEGPAHEADPSKMRENWDALVHAAEERSVKRD